MTRRQHEIMVRLSDAELAASMSVAAFWSKAASLPP